jgi:predicted aspartyl protease
MTSYNSTRFDPPAPVAYVILRNPATGAEWTDVPMLLDTGADITVLPQEVTARLKLEPLTGSRYELAGFDGSASIFQIVQLSMVFMGRTFHGQYPVIEQESGIIGRNVLNVLPLFFNGPRKVWGEYRDNI